MISHEAMLNEYQDFDVSEKLIKKLQRDLRMTRLMVMFSSLLMIVILAAGYYLYQVVQVYVKQAEGYVTEIITYAEGMEPAMTRIQEVDMEALCQTFSDLSAAFADVDFGQLANQLGTLDLPAISEKLNSLDVEAINEKLGALDVDKINDTLGGIDTELLSETLTSLNDAVASINDISVKLQQVAQIFN